MYTTSSLFIHVSGHLGCFHVFYGYYKQCCSLGNMCHFALGFSQGKCPVVGLLGHTVVLFLSF